ncbi:MAG TPA: alanine racemase [bacterium]|nr:alanine racemase [bacterium]
MGDFIRDTVLEIDLGSLRQNVRNVKAKVGNKRIIGVVKANAYGHGAARISRVLEEEGIDFFGVAIIEEALFLRDAGIKKPILIQSCFAPSRASEVVSEGLTAALSDMATAKALSDAASRQGKKVSVHIKVDTGLHRFGVLPQDVPVFVKKASLMEGIYIEGIYSHMASSKSTGEEYARMQISSFLKVLEELKLQGFDIPLRHMACSAAVIEFPESILDAVRVGTAFYGIKKLAGFDIKPVMSLKSRVVFVKDVPAGSYISYGMTYRTEHDTRIAVINMGYADGLPRALSNVGQVLIRGKRFGFAGVINMNNALIDVKKEDVSAGDEVVIMGRQGSQEISNDDIAKILRTSVGELPTRISSDRIPRIYYDENPRVL